METFKKSNAVIIGLKFSIINIMLMITVIVPLISVFPSVILEAILTKIIDKKPYNTICTIVIVVQFIGILIYLFFVRYFVNKQTLYKELNTNEIYRYMFGFQCFICGLVFYLNVAYNGFATDGQSVLSLLITHPIASLAFIPFGVLIEFSKNNNKNTFDYD